MIGTIASHGDMDDPVEGESNHAEDDMASFAKLLARLEPYYRQRRLIGVAGIGIGDLCLRLCKLRLCQLHDPA
jgi:hypothetical protein